MVIIIVLIVIKEVFNTSIETTGPYLSFVADDRPSCSNITIHC